MLLGNLLAWVILHLSVLSVVNYEPSVDLQEIDFASYFLMR